MEIDTEELERLADTSLCPFCGREPYHYVDIGVGMDRAAVDCCDLGIGLFQHGDDQISRAAGLLANMAREVLAHRKSEAWQPIETAPHEDLLVLGWYEGDVWKQEIALASAGTHYQNVYSDHWAHGRATHWMPLPAAPEAVVGSHER